MKIAAVFAIVFLLFSGFILSQVIFQIKKQADWVSKTVETEGTVVEVVCEKGAKGHSFIRPRLQFTSRSDRVIIFTASNSFRLGSYQVGEKVKIRYLPEKPEDACLGGFFDLWGGYLLMGIFAVVFFSIPAGILAFIIRMAVEIGRIDKL